MLKIVTGRAYVTIRFVVVHIISILRPLIQHQIISAFSTTSLNYTRTHLFVTHIIFGKFIFSYLNLFVIIKMHFFGKRSFIFTTFFVAE
jgi:hypothetical protein